MKVSQPEGDIILVELSEAEVDSLVVEIVESFSKRQLERLPHLNAFRHLISRVTDQEPRAWDSNKNKKESA